MLPLPYHIALRYLRSPKSHSVINLISWVALIALTVPTAALVMILSLHNGLSDTIQGMYNSFDSQLRVTVVEGKFFDPARLNLIEIPGVESVSYTIEDNILIRRGEREHLATIKGVDSNFRQVIPIENLITHGKYEPQLGGLQQATVGQGIAYNLGINPMLMQSIDIYAILPSAGRSVLPTPIYREDSIQVSGVYTLDEQSDSKFIFVPLNFAQRLLGFDNLVSSAEIKLTPDADINLIKSLIDSDFKAQTQFEQKESLYRAINQEKWIIYLLLMMVLLIASLSLAGSIVILIADKSAQIETLRSLGATPGLTRSIFRAQGVIIVGIGSLLGVCVGVGFSMLQQHFQFIKMAGSSTIIDAYPVRVDPLDILVITAGVWTLGWIISTITVKTTVKDIEK